MSWPLFFLTAKRLPPQSGKYTASPSTVGVAETSPPVVKTHFGFRLWTFVGLIECSAGWLQVLFRFCPAIRHWPDRDRSDWLCALSVETDKRTLINAVVGKNQLQVFVDMCTVLLEFVVCNIASKLLQDVQLLGQEPVSNAVNRMKVLGM